jgi:light-regulated signal transduction histidine kinase (bacteriophytochrome)
MMTIPISTPKIDQCDLEPVNFIGAIQPFGALLAFDESSGKLRFASANWRDVFANLPSYPTLVDFELSRTGAAVGKGWVGHHYRHEDLVVIEAEKGNEISDQRLERAVLSDLQAVSSSAELLDTAAKAVAKITGMDRVMIYRFHPDQHGEVVAEAISPGTESFLGLHYPASDIPAPARALFLKSWVRMIPTVDYRPVPIESLEEKGKTFDLGGSLLRAVSPIHLEYLRNMRVGASLTISLQQNGQLWGLIACHAHQSILVSRDKRAACESIGRFTSALLAVKNEQDQVLLRDRYHSVHRALVERMHSGEDMAIELTNFTPNLLDLISAEGSSAALYLSGAWVSIGRTPSEEQLEKLVSWLEKTYPRQPLFETDRLPSLFPEAESFKQFACGLMALHIPKTSRNYILWFRPEVVETVSWAGKPEKLEDAAGRLHPRASFALWTQEVSGRSRPWTELEKMAALELRNSIMATDLQLQFKKEQAARAEAERAVAAREELMAVLSHDLKNPVGSIKISAALGGRYLDRAPNDKLKELLERINRAANSMNGLIDDILSITKLESGYLNLEFQKQDVNALLAEVVEILQPIANEKRILLELSPKSQPCYAEVDRGAVLQVFSNLMGNAVKFTPDDGKITLSVDRCGPEHVKFSVKDTGPGIDPSSLPNIFDRFWQAKQARRLGTGLGLAIAKGLVQAHGGSIEAESDGKSGTTFHVSLPVAQMKE